MTGKRYYGLLLWSRVSGLREGDRGIFFFSFFVFKGGVHVSNVLSYIGIGALSGLINKNIQ